MKGVYTVVCMSTTILELPCRRYTCLCCQQSVYVVVAEQVQLLRKLLRTDCDGARKSMLEGKLVLPTNQAPSLPVIGGEGDGQLPMWGMPEVGQAGGLEHRIHAEARTSFRAWVTHWMGCIA